MNGLAEDITTQAAEWGQKAADILTDVNRLKQQYFPTGTPGINPDGSSAEILTTDTPLPAATASEESGVNWWIVGGVGALALWLLWN